MSSVGMLEQLALYTKSLKSKSSHLKKWRMH